jgi:hypothetical protein
VITLPEVPKLVTPTAKVRVSHLTGEQADCQLRGIDSSWWSSFPYVRNDLKRSRSSLFDTEWRYSGARWAAPAFQPADRALLAALSRLLPRSKWAFFSVTSGSGEALTWGNVRMFVVREQRIDSAGKMWRPVVGMSVGSYDGVVA